MKNIMRFRKITLEGKGTPLVIMTIMACLMLFCVAPALQAAEAPAMGGVQRSILGAQSRMIERSIKAGQSRMVTVQHPEALQEKGMDGVAAGDEVEVTRLQDGRLQVHHPGTGKTITVDDEP